MARYILKLRLPDGTGTARSAIALPSNAALLGASFCEQAVPVEFTGAFALAAVRGSNALALTIGTL